MPTQPLRPSRNFKKPAPLTPRPTEKSRPVGKPKTASAGEKPTEKPAGKLAAKPAPKAPPMPADLRRFINVYLSLGSNVGNRRENLKQVLGEIHRRIGKVAKQSHVYETAAWGKTDQDKFLNLVVMINTSLQPRDILEKITEIERELGRTRTEKWGPRTVDVDILFYGKRVIRDKGLEIPHPEIANRAFVLVPLMELDAELEHPILKQPIDELYMNCTDDSDVVMLEIPL